MSDASSFLIKMCKYDNFLYYTPSNVTTSFIFGDSGLMFLMALEWSGGFVEAIVVAMAMFVAMEWLRCGFFFVGLVMTMGLYWWSIWCWVCVGKFVFGKHIWRERERGINYNIHINSNCVNNCNYGSFCTSLYEPNFLLMLLYCD